MELPVTGGYCRFIRKIYAADRGWNMVCLAVVVFLFTAASDAQVWQKEIQEEGITVYNRTVPGSDFKEFRAESVFQSTAVNEVLNAIQDISSYDALFPDCYDPKVLKRMDDTCIIYYMVTKTTWPFRDRDGIYQQLVSRPTGNLTIHVSIQVLPDYLPESNHYARIRNGTGFWELKQLENSEVSVVYQFHTDPDEKVPERIARKYIVEDPFRTLQHLRSIL